MNPLLIYHSNFMQGYEYLGLRTNLDLKLSQGQKPKNKHHDMAYMPLSDIDKIRETDDYKLQEDAWKRVVTHD